MLRYLYLSIISLLFLQLSAQNQYFWKAIHPSEVLSQRTSSSQYIPEAFGAFVLDLKAFESYLSTAPEEYNSEDDYLLVELPHPDGSMKNYKVYYSPVVEKGLADKYPSIRSFKAFALNGTSSARFNIGPRGFNAAFSGSESIYIDPVNPDDPFEYMVYYTREYKEDVSGFNLSCGLDPEDILSEDLKRSKDFDPIDLPGEELQLRNSVTCDSVDLYTYRLALSCTGEWGSSHGNTVESALADMVTAVNRINQIYEIEFSVRLLLIEDNDKLIWLDKDTDPFEIGNVGYELLGVNTVVLNNNVGPNSYDIGHVFTRSCTDVGGVASLGSVCSPGRKGSAVTCHYSNNLNYIVVNVMAHEMGHQFSAHHTFNNCNGNESAGSDYEPGGGVTIMAYCGLCGSNNVDYECLETFHSHTIEEVYNFTHFGGGKQCANILSTGNTAPTVTLDYKNGFSIPIATPFILEGSAFDCEGDDLTYSWEEWDLGPQTQIGDPFDDSPIFTAMEPVDVPFRIFPAMNKIVNNFGNNSELLPTYSRFMKFRLTARDNNINGGGSSWQNVSFNADDSAGPFVVTYPNQVETYIIGDEIEIQWDVANTDNEIINCQTVNIWLSSDAGYTYTKLLKYNTPNDGAEKVYMPNIESSLIRFKVEAADNIFFDISDKYSKIEAPEEATFYIEATPLIQQVCLPDIAEVAISTAGFNDFQDSIRFEVSGDLPQEATVKFTPEKVMAGEIVSLELDYSQVNKKEFYLLDILAISEVGDTLTRQVKLDVVSNDYSDLTIVQPLPGVSGQGQLVDLIWTPSQSADSYNVYLSSSPAFPDDNTYSILGTSDTIFSSGITLEKSKVYYWKIEGINECGVSKASEINTFSTEAFACTKFGSIDLPEDIRSKQITSSVISIESEAIVADINVVSIEGDHDNFYDLDGALVGPDGTKVNLFTAKCFQNGALVFNFGMDDETTKKFSCPPYQGVYYPLGSLSDFKGKSAKGDWTLEIYDRQSPKGGELSGFQLEICSNSVLSNPYIVNNNSYKVAIGIPWDLSTEQLRADDDDNFPDELIYTIVELPATTSILKNGIHFEVGNQFTEQDLRDGNIRLFSNGSHGIEEGFSFTITDGQGGWLGLTKFSFILDEDVAIDEVPLDQQMKLYPNPSNDLVYLEIWKAGDYKLELFNLTGKILWSGSVSAFEKKTIDLNQTMPGLYYLKVSDKEKSTVLKVVKQ